MHPELFELKALVAGRLDAHRRREIDDHLGGCAECSRHYVAMMLGSSLPKTAEAEARQAAAPARAGAQMTFAGVASGPPLTASYGIDAPLAPSAPRPEPRVAPKPTLVRESDLPPSQSRTQVPVSASLVDAITRLRAESDARDRAAYEIETPVTPTPAVIPPAPTAPPAASVPVLRPPALWSDPPLVEDTPVVPRTAAINKVLPLGPRAADALPAPVAAAPSPAADVLPPLPAFSFAEYDDFDVPSSNAIAPAPEPSPMVTPESLTPSAVTPSAVTPSAVTPSAVTPSAVTPSAAPLAIELAVAQDVTLTVAAPTVAAPAVATPVVEAPVPATPAAPELVVTFSSTPTRRSPIRTAGIKPTAAFIASIDAEAPYVSMAVPVAHAVPHATAPLEEFHVPAAQPLAGMQPARLAAMLGGVAAVVVIGLSGYRYFQTSVSTAAAAAAAAAAKEVQAAASRQVQVAAPAAAPVASAPAAVQTRIVYVREPAKPESRESVRPDTQAAVPAAPVAVILPDVNLSTPGTPDNAALSATQRGATSELTRSARATSSRTVSRP